MLIPKFGPAFDEAIEVGVARGIARYFKHEEAASEIDENRLAYHVRNAIEEEIAERFDQTPSLCDVLEQILGR